MKCGSGHYKQLMEQYTQVTEVYLTLKPEYQKVLCPSCTVPCVTARNCAYCCLGNVCALVAHALRTNPNGPYLGPWAKGYLPAASATSGLAICCLPAASAIVLVCSVP